MTGKNHMGQCVVCLLTQVDVFKTVLPNLRWNGTQQVNGNATDFSCQNQINPLHESTDKAQLQPPKLEFILGKPYWSSSSRENSWWQLAMNFPRRFSRSDNLALVTETRHTSKQMLCSIVSFEWFLMKCDAKASVLPPYLLPCCEISTFFFKPSL